MTEKTQEATIEVNPQCRWQVKPVGVEKTPVLIIDDFSLDNTDIINYACESSEFDIDKATAYPGVRAQLTKQYVVDVMTVVYPFLYKYYAIPNNLRLKPQASYFSLITKPEEELIFLQRVPHIDASTPYYMAVLHYLNEGDFCDTGFFRHKPTGYEKIYGARLDEYVKAGDKFHLQHGEPEQKYVNQSTDQYELYDRIEYKANRIVAYPGCLLHSALVRPDRDLDPNPRTGRLTANIFVDFK